MAMEIGICSYSFHRLLAAGKQDIFQYILDCKKLGCTQLDPWNAHLTATEGAYIAKVKEAAKRAELPFGCIAVDGGHIHEPTAEARRENRERAYEWIEIARKLGARQIRLDAGGKAEMSEEEFEIIVEGFEDLVGRCRAAGVELVMENHFGASVIPENVVRILEAVKGVGLLLDSFNWAKGREAEGWVLCAKYARACHVKAFAFTEEGEELTNNVGGFVRWMKKAGYRWAWGVESVPIDGDEMGAAAKTIKLIRKYAEEPSP
ncbi:MAG TPA: TIM barrel protein [Tepidisphaeraceae bacterium]|jgi:sugar phosphate isomerase/epimerase|nr:TIM barrel protein [Tepidisphaeraceae bacterium]